MPFDIEKFGSIENEPPRFDVKRRYNDPTGAARNALAFLSNFAIPEGRAIGLPIVGRNIPPFIRKAIQAIHGHRDPDTHTRYYSRAMFCASRKNMKSYLSALFGILALYSRQEYNGEILIVAASQKQARRIFELTCAILRSNPTYWGQLRVQDVQAKLTNIETGTTLMAVAADPAKLYGMSPSVLLLDELHTWTGTKGQKLWTSVTTGMGARANPLTLITTTVPETPPAEGDIFLDQLRYFQKVEAGKIDDRRALPMLYLHPEDADIHDPKTWKAGNPALGFSITKVELTEAYEAAKTSDTGMAGFETMRLNRMPESSLKQGWLTPSMLEKVTGPVHLEDMRDAAIRAIGIDYGGSWDLASICVVADDDGDLSCLQRSFISQAGIERIRKKCPEVAAMVERGEITVEGEEAITTESFAAEVVDLAAYFDLTEVAIDPAMTQVLAPILTEAGLELVEARQGAMSMLAPVTLAEEAISNGRLSIDDDKCFAWALGNTGLQTSQMGAKPIKMGDDNSANPRKIDPVSAMLSAMQLIMEERNGAAGGDAAGVTWVCAYTDPVNAAALLDGGEYFAGMAGDRKDPDTGGWIVQS